MRTECTCGNQIAYWEEGRERKLLGDSAGMAGGHTAAVQVPVWWSLDSNWRSCIHVVYRMY